MRLRPIILCVLALGLAASSSAFAAKQSCKLVVDQEGDGRSAALPLITSPALDIVGADLASGRRDHVVGVLRLKTLNTNGDTAAYLNFKWTLAFQVQATNVMFRYERSTSLVSGARDSFSGEYGGAPIEGLTASISGDSITWKAPRKAFASTLGKKPGKLYLDNIAGQSNVNGGNADTATGGQAKYLDMSSSCVKAT